MSEIWSKKLFKVSGDRKKWICLHAECSKEFEIPASKSTTVLWAHYSTNHDAIFRSTAYAKKRTRLDDTEDQVEKKKPKLDVRKFFSPNMDAGQSKELADLVVDFVVETNQAFSIVNSSSFMALVRFNGNGARIPSRQELSHSLIPARAELASDSLKILQGKKVGFTMDTWTYRHHSLRCVTASYIDEQFRHKHHVLALVPFLSRHTGENIALQLVETIDQVGILLKDVVAITRDDGSNMIKAAKVFQGSPGIHCLCHKLHLVVKKMILGKTEIKQAVDKAQDVVAALRRSPAATAKFKEVQLLAGKDSTLLVAAVETRWNSTLEMISSFAHHKTDLVQFADSGFKGAAVNAVKKMSDSDYQLLEGLNEPLKVFEDVTKLASADDISISCYAFLARQIIRALKCSIESSSISAIRDSLQAALRDFENRMEHLWNDTLLTLSDFLDPRFKYKFFVYDKLTWETIEKQIRELMLQGRPENPLDETAEVTGETFVPLNDLWADEANEGDVMQEDVYGMIVKNELDLYKKMKSLPFPKPNSAGTDEMLKWWREAKASLPLLSVLAQEYLCPSPASALSERVFSKATLFFSNYLRSRISTKKASQILAIKAELLERNKGRNDEQEIPDDEDMEDIYFDHLVTL